MKPIPRQIPKFYQIYQCMHAFFELQRRQKYIYFTFLNSLKTYTLIFAILKNIYIIKKKINSTPFQNQGGGYPER